MTMIDRRRRRSDDTVRAIHLQLESCRRQAGLEAMILADGDGLCIANAGDDDACSEFAARVSVMQRERAGFDGEVWTDEARWDVYVRRFDYEGFALCLCAVGGLPDERVREIEHSLRGVTRILSA